MSQEHPVLSQLKQLQASERNWLLIYAFSLASALFVATWGLMAWTDFWVRSDTLVVRLLLSTPILVCGLWVCIKVLMPALRYKRPLIDIAKALEAQDPKLATDISLAADFLTKPQIGGSNQFRNEMVRKAQSQLKNFSPTQKLNLVWPIRALTFLVLVLILSGFMIGRNPDEAIYALKRSVLPMSYSPWPTFNELAFDNLPDQMAYGSSFECRVVDRRGRLPRLIHLELDDGSAILKRKMQVENEHAFFMVSNINRSIRVRATGGDSTTPWQAIEMIKPPSVTELSVEVQPPQYSGIKPYIAGPFEKIWAGSDLKIRGITDKEFTTVRLEMGLDRVDPLSPGANVTGLTAKKTASREFVFPFSAGLNLQEDLQFRVMLADAGLLPGNNQRTFRIPARPDLPPTIEISLANARQFYSPTDKVNVDCVAKDDMQLKEVFIELTLGELQSWQFPVRMENRDPILPSSSERFELSSFVTVDFLKLQLPKSDYELRIIATAVDSKGQIQRSEPLIVRIGSEEELASLEASERARIYNKIRTIRDLQKSAISVVDLTLTTDPNSESELFNRRLRSAAETQVDIRQGLFGEQGVDSLLQQYLESTFSSRSQNERNELERVAIELNALRQVTRKAIGNLQQAKPQENGKQATTQLLRQTRFSQVEILDKLENWVGKIDVQAGLQNLRSELQRIVQQQRLLRDRCITIQTMSDTSEEKSVEVDRLGNEQNQVTTRVGELSWGLVEDAARLESASLSKMGRQLKTIEVDSKRAESEIEKDQLGLAFQSMDQIIKRIEELIFEANIAQPNGTGPDPESVENAQTNLTDLRDEQQGFNDRLEKWGSLSASQKKDLANRIDRFGKKLTAFNTANQNTLSSNSRGAIADSAKLASQVGKDLKSDDVISARQKMKAIRSNLSAVAEELDRKSDEIAQQIRQQKLVALQRTFASWLEQERKIKLTLDDLVMPQDDEFEQLGGLQQKLTSEIRISKQAHEELFALALQLENLESLSADLEKSLDASDLDSSRADANRLVNELKLLIASPKQVPETTDRQDKSSSQQQTAKPSIQISEFEVRLLQQMQEKILAETRQLEVQKNQANSAQEKARLKKHALRLADQQSDLIATLDKYLVDKPAQNSEPPEIPDVPQIEDLPEIPDLECGVADEYRHQERSNSKPKPNRQNQEKQSQSKVEAVNPFTGQKAGEDIGEQSDQVRNRLEFVRDKMESVQKLLVQQELNSENQDAQQEIIRELKKFQTDQQKQAQEKSSKKSKEETKKNGEQAANSSVPDKESESNATEKSDPNQQIQGRIDEIWGQLPERLRKGELNIRSDQFLPKYRELLKAYFKRLASDPEIR